MHREIYLFGSGLSDRAKEELYGELSVLLASGINLKESLSMVAGMQKKRPEREATEGLLGAIVSGSSLSAAMENDRRFTVYEERAVDIGERTGELARVAGDLRGYFHQKNELKRQLVSTLSYPLTVLVLTVLIAVFMLRYVVPLLADSFAQNRVELPWITQKVMAVSGLLSGKGIWLLGALVVAIALFKWASATETFHRIKGKLLLRTPVLGNYTKRIYMIRFTQAMSLLTRAGIPVVSGISLAKGMVRFYPLERSLEQIEIDLVRGEKLHEAFGRHPIYDSKFVALLKVAEETNRTGFIFEKLYGMYSAEQQYRGKLIGGVFNVLITLLLGLFVLVILLAMYLPMFRLSSVIG